MLPKLGKNCSKFVNEKNQSAAGIFTSRAAEEIKPIKLLKREGAEIEVYARGGSGRRGPNAGI
jgi:hypothetical protein